jgi:hypothetical protein
MVHVDGGRVQITLHLSNVTEGQTSRFGVEIQQGYVHDEALRRAHDRRPTATCCRCHRTAPRGLRCRHGTGPDLVGPDPVDARETAVHAAALPGVGAPTFIAASRAERQSLADGVCDGGLAGNIGAAETDQVTKAQTVDPGIGCFGSHAAADGIDQLSDGQLQLTAGQQELAAGAVSVPSVSFEAGALFVPGLPVRVMVGGDDGETAP